MTEPAVAVDLETVEGLAPTPVGFGRQAWRRFRRHRLAVGGGITLVVLGLTFWLVPPLLPYGFTELSPDLSQSPSLRHPFGTDPIGRDLLVRALHGGRFSLRIALLVAVLTTAIGTLLGALAGYLGGIVDVLISQLTNLFLVVPAFVVLLVVGVRWGASPDTVALLLALLLWPQISRIVRSLFLQYREQEFVLAARAGGARSGRIMFRHVLPNAVGPIVVNATLLIGVAIILESTLSFLGLGVQPPTPTLGNLIQEAKGLIAASPHAILFPGALVVLIALSVNFLGDGLRDALDPASRKGSG